VVYSLGNSTRQWKDLWVSNNTIYINSVPVTLTQVALANGVTVNSLAVGTRPVIVQNQGNVVLGNLSATGNVSGQSFNWSNGTPVISNTGNLAVSAVSASGNITGNYFIGNGALLTGLPATYGNANVEAYLPVSNTIIGINANVANTNANVANLAIDISGLGTDIATLNADLANTNANVANVASNVATLQGQVYTDANVAAYLPTYTGNIGATNITVANTVTATTFIGNFQGNISGNLVVPGANTWVLYNNNGNAGADLGFRYDSATQNLVVGNTVTANFFVGDGSQLTGLPVAYGNANVSAYLASGNDVAGFTTAGDVSANNFVATTGVSSLGNVSVVGNVTGNYILGNGSQLTGLPVAYDNANVSAYLSSGDVTTDITTTANVSAQYFIGDGSKLTGIAPTVQVYEFANTITTGGYYSATWLADFVAQPAPALVTTTVSTTPTLLGGFITATGFPGITTIPVGLITIAYETQKASGTNAYQTYAEIYKYSTSNVETLLNTSDFSSTTAINTLVQQAVTDYVSTPLALDATDRILIKIYAVMTSGASRDITLRFDDNTNAGLQLPALPASITNFVPYTGATANVNLGIYNLSTTGNVSGAYFLGNGSQLTGLPAAYGNANVEAYLPVSNTIIAINANVANTDSNVSTLTIDLASTDSTVSVLVTDLASTNANVANTDANVANLVTVTTDTNANVANLTVTVANTDANVANTNANVSAVTANVSTLQNQVYANANVAAYLPTYTGNIQAGNISATTANATNITATTVTSANVTVTSTVGNGAVFYSGATGRITTSANINFDAATSTLTATRFSGNGALLTNLNAANLTGAYGNANVAAYLPTYTGNLQAGNAVITGNLLVQGTTTTINSNNISINDLVFNVANNANAAAFANGAGLGVGPANAEYATFTWASTSNTWISSKNLSAVGNVTGTFILGNGSQLTGMYSNATVAAYLPTYSGNVGGTLTTNNQPYITTVGTLGSLAVTDNINAKGLGIAGNATIGNLVVTGTTTIAGNITQISGNSGSFFGDAYGFGALYAGISSGFANLPATVTQFSADYPDYAQLNFQNINAGPGASADYVATADNGTNTTHYVDLGIASSTYDGLSANALGTSIKANDAYLYTFGNTAEDNGGNLVIGAGTAGKEVKVIAGGGATANIVAVFANTGLTVSGLISAAGNVTGANIETTGNVSADYVNVTQDLQANYISASANISGGNVIVTDTLYGLNVNVTGNVDGGYLNITDSITATGTITGGNIATAGTVSATGNITGNNIVGGNVTTTGTVSATGNIDSANVNTAGAVSATGNVTGVNLNTAGAVSATGNVTGSNINTAGQVSATGSVIATGNITGGNINTAGLASVTGNVQAGNIRTNGTVSATGNITANLFVGNGSVLTGVNATGVANGTSNITLTSTGNITMSVNSGTNFNLTTNSVAIGNNAGANTQASNAVAIGTAAGNTVQQTNAIAIGTSSAATNQGANSIAIGTQAGSTGNIATSTGAFITSGVLTILGNSSITGTFATTMLVSGNGITSNTVISSTQPSTIASANISGTTLRNLSTVSGTYPMLVGAAITGNGVTANTYISSRAISVMAGSSISGTTLTVGTLTGDPIEVGMYLSGAGIINGVWIVSNISGSGSGSTWQLSTSLTVAFSAITGAIWTVSPSQTVAAVAMATTYYAVTPTQTVADAVTPIAITGSLGQGASAVAIGSQAGQNTQGTFTVAIGSQAATTNQGSSAVAIGRFTGNISQGAQAVAIGFQAGTTSQGATSVAIGPSAGFTSQGLQSVAIGLQAGQTSQAQNAVAIGVNAGGSSQSASAVAVGIGAGQTTQGASAVAVGVNAGQSSQGAQAVALGWLAGSTSQAASAVAIGFSAGTGSQGASAVAVGVSSGGTSQGASSVAVGSSAGGTSQGAQSVAVGFSAGLNYQGISAVAVGTSSALRYQFPNSVAIGNSAGQNTQRFGAIAIGNSAGFTGDSAVATNCTITTTTFSASGNVTGNISVGMALTGTGIGANTYITAFGTGTGGTGTYIITPSQTLAANTTVTLYTAQGNSAIAIGNGAGYYGQGANSVAIGTFAGNANQGINSVAIGRLAGNASQPANSIIINASGTALNGNAAGFYVDPVRNDTGNTANVVYYNTSTKELTYASASPTFVALSSGGNIALTVAFQETQVPFSTVDYDSNGWYSTSTNRYTPQRAGYYQIEATATVFPTNGNLQAQGSILIRKNGTSVTGVSSFGAVHSCVSRVVQLNGTTDYVDIAISNGNLGNALQQTGITVFSGFWIRPL
jgi:hypothetical protein